MLLLSPYATYIHARRDHANQREVKRRSGDHNVALRAQIPKGGAVPVILTVAAALVRACILESSEISKRYDGSPKGGPGMVLSFF